MEYIFFNFHFFFSFFFLGLKTQIALNWTKIEHKTTHKILLLVFLALILRNTIAIFVVRIKKESMICELLISLSLFHLKTNALVGRMLFCLYFSLHGTFSTIGLFFISRLYWKSVYMIVSWINE